MFLALALFCTLIEAVFTALEVATNGASRTRLRALSTEENDDSAAADSIEYSKLADNSAQQVLQLLERPQRLAWMFLCVTSLTMWTAACAVVWHAALFGWNWKIQLATLAAIVFGAEVLPLLVAARHPERVAMWGARPIELALRLLEPLIVLLRGAGSLGARSLGAQTNNASGVTPHELRTALATAEEAGVIESDERALLEGAMDFREKCVREVMTPKNVIVVLRETDSLKIALQTAMQESHSRLPVVDENGACVGIVAAKDLIPHGDELFAAELFADENATPRHRVRDIMRAPLWVEESAPVAFVLEELRRHRSLMALVRNASGETVGLVTLEDLLEEIVGEIQDEYDDEAPLFTRENGAKTNESAASSTRSAQRSVLCDANAKLREAERFWREEFGETARLQIDGEAPPSSMSLRDFATQLFASKPTISSSKDATQVAIETESPSEISPNFNEFIAGNLVYSARVEAGFTIKENEDDDENREAEIVILQLEVAEMHDAKIEKIRLICSNSPE